MSKLKNIFKLSVLGVASLSLIGGAGLLFAKDNQPTQSSSADTYVSVNNEQHDFFIAEWKDKDKEIIETLTDSTSPLVLANSDDYINLRFDIKEIETETDKKTYLRYPEGKSDGDIWDCFTFTNFSIKRNGQVLEFNSTNPSYVLKQTGGTTYAPPVGQGTMGFDLKITYTNADVSLNDNILNLKEEGVYEISIPYTMYSTSDNGDSFDSSESSTLVWTFMLFDHDTYLASGLNTPNINIQNFASVEGNNLYYNYQTDSIPYIDYDVTRFNLTVKKTLNEEETSLTMVYNYDENIQHDYLGNISYVDGKIQYNDAFANKYSNNGIFELKFNKENKKARIYFKDIGKYTLTFEMIYSINTNQVNPSTYILPKTIEKKQVYMFGYQSTYTRYNTSTNSNEYPEFKKYDSSFKIEESADISNSLNLTSFPTTTVETAKIVTPVTTNQAPVKFKEFANYSSAYLYPVEKAENDEGKTTIKIKNGTQITATKNVSLSGSSTSQLYLAIFEYTFEDYISGGLSSPNTKFYQAFYFQITNATPTVDVKAGGTGDNGIELSSMDFTNKDVYIKNNYDASTFNSNPIIEIVREDFINKTFDDPKSLNEYDKEETSTGTYYKITENGKYTINIYSGRNGKQGTPITRQFTIDRTDIEDVEAYGVELKNSSEYRVATSNLQYLTNQPLIFSWKNTKDSGANTFGYYKYYPLEVATADFSLSNVLAAFLENLDCIPVSYKLNLNNSSSWIRYPNAESLVNSNAINASYVKTGAGLYFLFVEDQAGNQAVKIYLMDNTSSPFVIKKTDQLGTNVYSLLGQNDTISQDATIYWGGNKVYQVTTTEGSLLKDYKASDNEKIDAVYEAFKTQYITNLTAVPSSYQGSYVKIPFTTQNNATKVLFKDLGTNDFNFTNFENNRYNIISSFSLSTYTSAEVTHYYLSSTSGVYYETNITDLTLCKNGNISSYELYSRAYTNKLDPSNPNYTEIINNITDYTGDEFDNIYNREGSFNFLIRDIANTKGNNLSETQQYLNYPTGYQIINLTSDKSELKVVYSENSKDVSLISADFASVEGKLDPNSQNVAENKYKNAYYEPTSIDDILSISFIPKIVNGTEIIQVDSINVKFYPFVKKCYSSNNYGSVVLNYYKDLSLTPSIDLNIPFDSEATTAQKYKLNITNGKTQEGKYVITRLYKTGESYTIDKYDYMKRTLEFIVDRENVISEPEVITATTKTYTITGENITLSTIGSMLVSNQYLGGIIGQEDFDYSVKVNGSFEASSTTPISDDSKYYYIFDEIIDNIELAKNGTPISIGEPSIKTESSAQSIVGNGILISVFSGTDNSVEFPSLKETEDKYASYNSGYTFYTTTQSYSDTLKDGLNAVFTTNKRPFKIYIPAYKYTTHNVENNNSFETTNNSTLTTFHDDVAIDYYELYAEVYRENEKYAISDSIENGFLTFKKINGEELINFTEAGTYIVVITQAYNSIAIGGNSFKNNYAFKFVVESGNPDFALYSSKGYTLDGPRDINNQLTDTLYTNEKEILARWYNNASEYITNIDIKKIKLTINGNEYLVEANRETNSIDKVSLNGVENNEIKNALSYHYYSSSLLNELSINLEKIGIYKHGEEIFISLEYENPSNVEGIYTPKTKKVIVDSSIYDANGDTYNTTLDELFSKISFFSNVLTLNNLRQYLDISGNTTTDKLKTCFSQTVSSDFYRYYCYLVDKSFFNDLKTTIEKNKLSNPNGKTSIYLREVEDIYDTNFEETNYDSFFTTSTSFTNIDNMTNYSEGKYYEVIERDYAGNLNIYLVYLYKSNAEALIYSDSSNNSLSDEQILTNRYNIYGTTELKLKEICLHNDKWNFVKVQQNGKTYNYIKTPWLSEGYIQNISTGESVSITTLLNDSSTINKTILSISDRADGQWKNVYISKSNISNLILENLYSDSEGIKIKLPSGDVMTTTSVVSYPVAINIEVTVSGVSNPFYYTNNPLNDISTSASYQQNWNSKSDNIVLFEYSATTNYLTLSLTKQPEIGTKIKYTVTDNFGKTSSTIHIFGTDFTDGYEYTGYLYQDYDEDGNLVYFVQNSFTYQYNSGVYNVEIYDASGSKITDYSNNHIIPSSGTKYNSFKFEKQAIEQLNQKYEIRVYDANDPENKVKSLFVCIYDILPRIIKSAEDSYDYVLSLLDQNGNSISDKFTGDFGNVNINGKDYTYEGAKTFATMINVSFTKTLDDIPYRAYIYRQGDNEFTPIESGYQIKNSGVYYILFKYEHEKLFTHEYLMYKLEILDSSTNFFYVTLDGNIIEAQKSYFTHENKQYSNYYLVNVAYTEKSRVKIETNIYQKVYVSSNVTTIQKQGVTTVIYTISNKEGTSYPSGVSPYNDEIAISYVPSSTTPSQKFSYVSPNGEEVSILNESSAIVTAEKGSSFNQLIVKWSNYFGLSENKVYIKVEKDGRSIDVPTYYESTNGICYTILDISGLYKISLWDYAGNRQMFGTRDYFELIFLKDSHFTMIHTENGQEIKTEAIDKGIFNGNVTLVLENTKKFYLSSSVNKITATKNGVEYTPIYDPVTSSYTFNTVGFYQVYFTTTATNGVDVREQVYSFTIINPNESRYAFSYSPFNEYLITKVFKNDGITDIVEKSDMENKDSIYVSYYDENTGVGTWTVTIDTNKKLNISDNSDETTKFNFTFLIRSAIPPIEVSATEGSTTTGTITVSFNAENIYNAVGDCILSFGNNEFHINSDTISTLGVQTINITEAGTYFIQVSTESGNLLYSYMVVKKDPLNAWAIVAIVLGSVAVIATIIIVIKLRKRIKVK